MPAVGGIWYNHPQTLEPGLWIEKAWGDRAVIGRSDTQIAALVPSGNPGTRLARFATAVQSYLQALCEERIPDADIVPDDPVRLTPEPYCRWEGGYYVQRICVVTIEGISLSPLRYQITISEGASRSTYY